jgi:hypothetical protein
MMLGFHADYEELVALKALFKAATFEDYSIINNPASTSEAQAAGRKVYAEIKNSLPPDENCLDDDLFHLHRRYSQIGCPLVYSRLKGLRY